MRHFAPTLVTQLPKKQMRAETDPMAMVSAVEQRKVMPPYETRLPSTAVTCAPLSSGK